MLHIYTICCSRPLDMQFSLQKALEQVVKPADHPRGRPRARGGRRPTTCRRRHRRRAAELHEQDPRRRVRQEQHCQRQEPSCQDPSYWDQGELLSSIQLERVFFITKIFIRNTFYILFCLSCWARELRTRLSRPRPNHQSRTPS